MKIDAQFLRTIDWARTPLGPMEQWPRSLKSYVDMILGLPTPAIIFWGPDLTQIYNDGYAAIMGPRHPRYFGGTYKESWPETYPLIIPWMRQVLADGSYFEVARAPFTMTRHAFSEEAHFSFTFSPLRDDEGRIAGVYQPVVELTESVLRDRRAETMRVLAQGDSLFESAAAAFAANAHDIPFAGIYLFNESEHRLKLAASSGFARAALAGQALQPLEETLARAHAGNASLDAPLATPIHAGPWPEPVTKMFATPLRRAADGAPIGAIAFGISPRLKLDVRYRDFFEAIARELGAALSARRAAEAEREWKEREQAARREAEIAHARRMSVLFEHAPVGIAVLRGEEHVYEVANPFYASLVSNRALLRLPIREALPELAGQGVYELLDRVYQTGEPWVGRSIPLSVARGDGVREERVFDFVYQPFPDDAGKIDSIIVVVFEVTDLAKARSDAETASRAKDEFFAILGHELRNPLAPITTALQLMRMRGDPSLEKERNIIERQVGQITRLVDDLLDVSRITRGKVSLKREPIELGEVVAKAIEMTSPLFEQRRHHLQVEVARHGLAVEADSIRLAQVISNLLTNAAKYTEPEGTVSVVAGKSRGQVYLRVSDTGMGIPAEMLPKIFEPFAQEHQALDRAQGGLGLGLAIVANLVKLHGGTVIAESPGRGRGSTFTVELPLAAQAAQAAEPQPSLAGEAKGEKKGALRVLVVDDNRDAAEMLAEALNMLGYDTLIAHDAAEALRVAGDFAPQIALLDIGLPVMDGYELAVRLRKELREKSLRLVAVTGYGQESDRLRAMEAGFDAHLVKPVQLDVVADLIGQYGQALN